MAINEHPHQSVVPLFHSKTRLPHFALAQDKTLINVKEHNSISLLKEIEGKRNQTYFITSDH